MGRRPAAVAKLGGDNMAAGPERVTLTGGTVSFRSGGMPGRLQLWVDAGAIGGMTDGDPVAMWADQSGQGHDLAQGWGDSSRYPRYYSSGIGGRPVVRFDGNDYLWATTYDMNNPFTVFAVANMEGTQNGRLISSQNINWLMGYWGNWEGVLHADGWITDPSNPNANTFSPPDQNPDLWAASNTGSSAYAFYKNGVDITRNAAGGNDRIGRLALGGYGDAWETSRGDVAEVLIFDRVLSATELDAVGGYLAAKYGLTTTYGGNVTPDLIDLPHTQITATADAELFADTPSTATFGRLNVRSGATLGLSGAPGGFFFGTAGGAGTVDGSFTVQSILDPGDGDVGTLTVTGELALADGTVYRWELSPGGHDEVEVTEPLMLDDWTLVLLDAGGEAKAWEKLYLFTGAGATNANLALPGNWQIDPDIPAPWLEFTDPADLRIGVDNLGVYLLGLQTVPEPSTFLLAASGLLGLGLNGWGRRKKKLG